MGKLKNLEDLFQHQVKDVYNAEKQLVDALPKMEKKASNEQLKQAINNHLKETENHVKRLEEIGNDLGFKPAGETCEAMKGLIKESESLFSEDAEPEVKDAGIIADAQRIEHYEISAYGTLVAYAKSLNYDSAVDKLQQTLNEETATDEKLNKIALENINKQAKAKAS